MTRTYYLAAALLGLSALISIVLWANGYPPAWETDKGETIALLRSILTAPLALASIGAVITIPIAYSKRHYVTKAGKASALPAMGVLAVPVSTLALQALLPLMLYDLVADDFSQLLFLGLLATFFLIMGNYIVTAPPDAGIGMRNKWTLSDPVVWTRTHRAFGRNLVMAALLIPPLGFLIDPRHAQWVLIGTVMSLKAVAWLHARHLAMQHALRNAEV